MDKYIVKYWDRRDKPPHFMFKNFKSCIDFNEAKIFAEALPDYCKAKAIYMNS